VLRSAVLLGVVASCAAKSVPDYSPPRGPVYKPGQSIAESRLCTCDVCAQRACCSGEPAEATYAEPELGMTFAACGRCTRRVWTARGAESCDALAGSECCPGTVSD
jgi:hypothetical protein